jgi:hypothetical protein
MIAAKSAHTFIVDGPVITMPTYNLLTTAGTDLNFIMHPMTKAALTTAGAIGTDIGTANVGTVSKWNAATQVWVGTSYNAVLGWIGNYTSEIANPLMLNMKANVAAWPYSKDAPEGYDVFVESTEKSVPKGTPKDFYYEVFQADGTTHFNFSAAPYDGCTAKAWIGARPLELLTTPIGITLMDMGGISIAYVNPGNFPTAWATGNVLFLVVKDEDTNIEGYNYDDPLVGYTLDGGDASAVFD